MRERSTEHFLTRAPRPNTPSVASESLDRLMPRADAEELWMEDAATHTELSDEQDKRLERLTLRLAASEGADPAQVKFIVRVDQLVKEYKSLDEEWAADDPKRKSTTLEHWCMEHLADFTANKT